MSLNRRSFLEAGMVTIGALGVRGQAAAELIYKRSDWDLPAFDRLLKVPARVKQLFDIGAIEDGGFLTHIKNSLNGFQFGFGVPADQIKIVAALHGPSNTLNFNDSMWEKYKIGEFLRLNDPQTGKPATRNPYLQRRSGGSTDPEDQNSVFQDASLEALQGRGIQFLSCHNSTEGQARAFAAHLSLKTPPEEIVQDLQAHLRPEVQVVPAMVAAVSILQSDGHFTYITT